jgi:hypothetical protein
VPNNRNSVVESSQTEGNLPIATPNGYFTLLYRVSVREDGLEDVSVRRPGSLWSLKSPTDDTP